MDALLVDRIPLGEKWLYEPKWTYEFLRKSGYSNLSRLIENEARPHSAWVERWAWNPKRAKEAGSGWNSGSAEPANLWENFNRRSRQTTDLPRCPQACENNCLRPIS